VGGVHLLKSGLIVDCWEQDGTLFGMLDTGASPSIVDLSFSPEVGVGEWVLSQDSVIVDVLDSDRFPGGPATRIAGFQGIAHEVY